MERTFKNFILGAGLALCSAGANAQGLQGVIVENYHTTTQADADYYNGLGNGSGIMTPGLTTYRVYIDMAPGYRLNTVFGSASNVLDFTSTTVFWNDDGFGSQVPPQTSRLDDGAAFDSWVTIGRATRALGTAGCTGNLQQLGVPKVSDTNGNLTMCNLWSGFGPTDNDGHVPGTSIDPTFVGISAADLTPFVEVDGGTVFTTTGSWALLPTQAGPEINGDNRVLIGQFTTAGTFSFKINISLQTPDQQVEFYTHTNSESGSTVSPLLTYPTACTPVQIASTSSNSPICSNQTLNLGVVATGTEPINYTWTGVGIITNGTTANATVTGAATGNYTVAVSNGCGNVSQNVSVVVNTAVTYYADVDGDGFGDPNGATQTACTAPSGFVANNTDQCPNDANKQTPGACGCGVAEVPATYYADADGDGFGAGAAIPGFTCNVPAGTVTNNTDQCPNDANKQTPGACGCGVADVPATYYADVDGDGFGDPAVSQPGFTCNVPAGFVANNTDNCPAVPGVIGSTCNDGNPNTSGDVINASCQCQGSTIPCPDDGNPCTAEVVVNGVCTHQPLPDTDGDGTCDLIDGCPADANKIAPGACGCGVADMATTYYADVDGDGFGDPAVSQPGFTCNVPAGFVANSTDNCPAVPGVIGSTCNDGNPNTSGDVINASCQCEGSSVPCPDDGNPCTAEVVVNGVCTHQPLPDTDGDGTCDLIDGCPADANKIAPGACGCGVADMATTYYADVDGDGFGDPAVSQPGFTCNVPAGFVANSTDNCPSIAGVIGSVCNDGNANTTGDVIDANCQCAGTPVGGGCQEPNQLQLVINADGVSTTLWEVRAQGSNTLVLSGGQLYAAGTVTESLCLPNGCFYLVVTDDAGNGITGGGYVLRTSGGQRIIDNAGNFTTGSTSAIAGNEGFCLPLGTDRITVAHCDRTDWRNNEYLAVNDNAAVTAVWNNFPAGSVQRGNSGYQIWFYNPNGGYSFRQFQSHNTSNGFAVSAVRAAHFKINGWSGNQLQNNVLYNVKVRSRVLGTYAEWGAACRFVLDPMRAMCPLAQLNDQPGQFFSCNSSRTWGGGSYIAARPVFRINANGTRTNANRYQFRFRNQQGTTIAIRSNTTYTLTLNWAPALAAGTYNVDVRASFDGGATWCSDFIQPSLDPWGPVCTLTINPAATGGNQNMADGAELSERLTLFPNPNRGDAITLTLGAVAADVNTVSVDVYDTFGKRVSARTIAVQDGYVNTVLDLNGELAAGMYVVSVTAGTQVYTERLVVQP